jgi:VRR-NUC domain-containing protein
MKSTVHWLARNSTEKIRLLSGKIVHVPKCRTCFAQWRGRQVPTYGGKALLRLGEQPLFAELLVLHRLKKEGWRGVWVDSYGGTKYRVGMPHLKKPVPLLPAQEKLLKKIRDKADCKGGCFDVFAWRGKKHRFVELKRRGKDRVRKSQKRWLAAARNCGIKMSDLLIVEWGVAH